MSKLFGWLLTVSLLVGCSSSPDETVIMPPQVNPVQPTVTAPTLNNTSDGEFGRYGIEHDLAPSVVPDLHRLIEPTPKYEPFSRGGNSNYQVWGQTYKVLPTTAGYREEGIASWYGVKFHGHQTSNGETYDMFDFSAAHRSLPLPAYAKVTNLNNGISVVVRVNDRGPFHSDRVIDLSYAAAWKLDMLEQGTAPVRVEAYHFDGPSTASDYAAQGEVKPIYIQLVASQSLDRMYGLKQQLEREYSQPFRIQSSDNLHKLQLGPVLNPNMAHQLMIQFQNGAYPQAYKIYEL